MASPTYSRDEWHKLLADAREHYAAVFRRSLLDLDRAGQQWDAGEVAELVSAVSKDVWLAWDALPPIGGRR